MDSPQDHAAIAKAIIDSNMYMTLGTADGDGRPWVSPVYYACSEYTEFFWVSSPDATHSRNISVRPQISIVVFNSQVPVGTGQGVYMSAAAMELSGGELERGIDVFSRGSVAHGAPEWALKDVVAPAPYRLFRATVSEHSILDPDAHPNRRTVVVVAKKEEPADGQ